MERRFFVFSILRSNISWKFQVEILCGVLIIVSVVKITVASQELPTKIITENPIWTNHFIMVFRSYWDWPVMFYFLKVLEVFLFLLITFLYFVSLFIKKRIQRLAFFLLLLIPFLYSVSLFMKEWIQWLVFQLVILQLFRLCIFLCLWQ